MKRSHFAFLHAAFSHAGWEIEDDVEGVTTDDGYDHELLTRVKVRVPLDVLQDAPDQREVAGDALDRLMRDLRVVA